MFKIRFLLISGMYGSHFCSAISAGISPTGPASSSAVLINFDSVEQDQIRYSVMQYMQFHLNWSSGFRED